MSIIIDGNSGISTAGGTPIVNTTTNPTSLGTVTSITSIGNVSVTGVGYGHAFADGSLQTTVGYTGFRNRIINGDMRIDQRNAGASVTPTNGQYSVDRWYYQVTQSSKLTAQQSSVAPAGFSNSLLTTSSSAYSIVAGDAFNVAQNIEGYNMADLAWGTSSAKTIVLSFQVYSSLTGTFGGCVSNSAFNRSYPFTYSISSANTWTSISVAIPGDTTGTWLTTNGTGLRIYFGLGVGSTYSGTAGAWAAANYFSATGAVSVVGTSGATWYITGVQFEVGSTATVFERRQFGVEVGLCQRYYCKTFALTQIPGNNLLTAGALRGTARTINASSQIEPGVTWRFPVSMRATPSTITLYSPAASGATNGQWTNDGNGSYSANARAIFQNADGLTIDNTGILLAASQPWIIHAAADAEL
jgi:hypothetical protein